LAKDNQKLKKFLVETEGINIKLMKRQEKLLDKVKDVYYNNMIKTLIKKEKDQHQNM